MSGTVEVRRGADGRTFEIWVDEVRAGVEIFVDLDGRRIMHHTVVDEAFAGQGLAGQLVKAALAATAEEGLRIVAVCPYVAAYVKRHHDWDDLLDPVTPEILAALS